MRFLRVRRASPQNVPQFLAYGVDRRWEETMGGLPLGFMELLEKHPRCVIDVKDLVVTGENEDARVRTQFLLFFGVTVEPDRDISPHDLIDGERRTHGDLQMDDLERTYFRSSARQI